MRVEPARGMRTVLVSALVLALVLATSGCSFLIATEKPARAGGPASCPSIGWPLADTVLAAGAVGFSLYTIDELKDDDEGSPVAAGAVIGGVVLGAVLGASAIYGYVKAGRCASSSARPAAGAPPVSSRP